MDKNKKSASRKSFVIFDTVSFYILLAVLFLLPLFFLPALQISLLTGKGFLVAIGTSLSLFFWLLARLVEGKIRFPQYRVLWAAAGLPLALFLSALFSPYFRGSVGGSGFEVATVAGSLVLFAMLFLSAVFFQEQRRVFVVLGALGASFVLVSLFHLGELFFGLMDFFPRVFGEVAGGTLLGSWSDLALFAGLMAIFSLVAVEMLPLGRKQKWTLYVFLLLALFFLAVSNFLIVWLLVGLFALFIFVYALSFLKEEKGAVSRFPTVSFVAVLVCLVFVLANNFFGAYLSNKFRVVSSEVRPSVVSTYGIATSALSKSPVVGVGPNRFSQAWDLYKTKEVNNTRFWSTSFTGGFGWIPSFAVTTGILGVLAWLTLLVLFIGKGFKYMFVALSDRPLSFVLVSSFLGALYLWMIALVYLPNITSIALAFVMTGLCIGSWSIKKAKNVSFSFLDDPRTSFFSILALVALMIGVVWGGYLFTEKFVSVVYFEKAVYGPADSQLMVVDNAEKNMLRAIALHPSDMYYRTLAQVYIGKFNLLLRQTDLSVDALKPELQAAVQNAESAAQRAVSMDGRNYLNWVALGQVYESFMPVGIQSSYESAVASYDRAVGLNPNNPSLYLSLANIELNRKNIEKARSYINRSLEVKGDMPDGLLLLARYQEGAGNAAAALDLYKQGFAIAPSSPEAASSLGYYQYKNGRYSDAVGPFERATVLAPSDMQIRYYLAMSYAKAGQKEQALRQFEYLLTLNPGNKDIENSISNIRAGRPVEGTSVPASAPDADAVKKK